MRIQEAHRLFLDVRAAEERWERLMDLMGGGPDNMLPDALTDACTVLVGHIMDQPARGAADLNAKADAFAYRLTAGQSPDDPCSNDLAPDVARRVIAELRTVAGRMEAPPPKAPLEAVA